MLNGESTIGQSLDSLYDQSFGDFEHIIQDCCSTDDTIEVVESFKDSRSLIYSEKDKGIYDAINRGIERSTGDIIGLLHSDDRFANARVLELVAKCFENPAISIVYGGVVFVSDHYNSKVSRVWMPGQFKQTFLKFGWMPPHTATFMRRAVFKELGYYDESYTISGDYDFFLRLGKQKSFGWMGVGNCFVRMKVGGNSSNFGKYTFQKFKEDIQASRQVSRLPLLTAICKRVYKVPQFFIRKDQ